MSNFIQDEKKSVRKRSVSGTPETRSNLFARKGRLNRIKFIKVKEIHPDAPESSLINKHDENERTNYEAPKEDVNFESEGRLYFLAMHLVVSDLTLTSISL